MRIACPTLTVPEETTEISASAKAWKMIAVGIVDGGARFFIRATREQQRSVERELAIAPLSKGVSHTILAHFPVATLAGSFRTDLFAFPRADLGADGPLGAQIVDVAHETFDVPGDRKLSVHGLASKYLWPLTHRGPWKDLQGEADLLVPTQFAWTIVRSPRAKTSRGSQLSIPIAFGAAKSAFNGVAPHRDRSDEG